MASDPVAAQSCPAVLPARAKGPLVFLDMDQHDIDDAYDNDILSFNVKNIGERRVFNNDIARSVLGAPTRVAYGEAEIEKLDIFRTNRQNAPTMIFIHGGSWRGGRSTQFVTYAEPFVKLGANYIVVDFSNVGETNGDITPMVDQCRRAVAWVYRNAASFGGDSGKLYMCSRSSGSHLAACVLTTEWEKQGLPRDILKGAVLGSGMYDLKPVSLSRRGNFVKFTDAMVEQLSPIRYIDRIHTPVVVAHGSLETREFQRQAREFVDALKKAGKPAELVVGKGYNHYETGETLGNPFAVLGRAMTGMMKLLG